MIDDELSYEEQQTKELLEQFYAESMIGKLSASALVVASRLAQIASVVLDAELAQLGITESRALKAYLLQRPPSPQLGLQPFTMTGVMDDLEQLQLYPEAVVAANVRVSVPGMESTAVADYEADDGIERDPLERRGGRNILDRGGKPGKPGKPGRKPRKPRGGDGASVNDDV